MRVTVIGAGAWGTALANLLGQNKHSVTLWGHDALHLREMEQGQRNDVYLPAIVLCPALRYEADLATAARGSEVLVVAVPSKHFREITQRLSDFSGIVVSVTKGIELETGLTMCGILGETMPRGQCAAISGPTLALEVARDIPAASVAACSDLAVARKLQQWFNRPTFRVYTSQDLIGVELGGALKNVVAIAAGIGDGVGFGDNSKAGLVTRAIVELRRLGVACGAMPETFSGLSGLGDLMVTCFSKLSRNRQFGERIGRGEKVEDILSSSVSVAEGHPNARSAYRLARKMKIKTPILDEVHATLYEGKEARHAIRDLMSRDLKEED